MDLERVSIRAMQPEDLDFAVTCTRQEGWVGETRPVFEDFLAHNPQGCFLAELNGRPLGICMATSYGRAGFIGELIIASVGRGAGLGGRLLRQAIHYLRGRGVEAIFLDGVRPAVSLYERAGFTRLCPSLRFKGILQAQPRDSNARRMGSQHLEAVLRLDREAFGADRSFFLKRRFERYPELCAVIERHGQVTGAVFGKHDEGVVVLGPWLAMPEERAPESLLYAVTQTVGDCPITLGALASHPFASGLLRVCGLRELPEPPWRMRLGVDIELGASPTCLAIGSPAKG